MASFAEVLLPWFEQHGRHDLPWQHNRTLYSVWVSEIMLQQTQVATVIPYYERFMSRFDDIAALAAASQDEVLLHWAGLGYYSRARNLHAAAQQIVESHQGAFPTSYDDVLALPGIGPSTAGAILAQALDQRYAILDGNVKRVLARYHAVEGWPGQSGVHKQLWQYAESHTPQKYIADYTQAIMDLGATVCTRAAAKCDSCPLQDNCRAYADGTVAELPSRKPRKALPVRQKRFLIIRNEHGEFLLEKRPSAGIWGGLWSLPEISLDQAVSDSIRQQWMLDTRVYRDLPVLRHTFSHFHLDITPCEVYVESASAGVADSDRHRWLSSTEGLALATPVSLILQENSGEKLHK